MRMGTIEQRIDADSRYTYGRVMFNPSGGCYAVLKLGTTWAKAGRPILCSGKRVSEDNAFCGRHDHLNFVIFGDEDYLMRALRRAGKRGLKFPEPAPAVSATTTQSVASPEGNDGETGAA